MSESQSSGMPPIVRTCFMERHGPLPFNFFNSAPSDAPAIFSTKEGKLRRRLFNNHRMSPQISRTCDTTAMMEKIRSLRRDMPDACNKVKAPKSVQDLHIYFDPVDLWSFTAGFLGDLLEEMARQNEEKMAIITSYVNEWVNDPDVYQQASKIPIGCMEQLLAPSNCAYLGYDDMEKSEQQFTIEALNKWREKVESQLLPAFQSQQAELAELERAQKRVASQGVSPFKHTHTHDSRRQSSGRGSSFYVKQSQSAPTSALIGMLPDSSIRASPPVLLSHQSSCPPSLVTCEPRELGVRKNRYGSTDQDLNVGGSSSSSIIIHERRNVSKFNNTPHQNSRAGAKHAQCDPARNSRRQLSGYHFARHMDIPCDHADFRASSTGHSPNSVFGDGLPINDIYLRPREKTTAPGSWKMMGMAPNQSTAHQVYVRGLPNEAYKTDDLMIAMSQYGNVVSISFLFDKETRKFRGIAWVGFESNEEVERAAQYLNGTYILGKSISVAKNIYKSGSAIKNKQSEQFGSLAEQAATRPQFSSLKWPISSINKNQDARNHIKVDYKPFMGRNAYGNGGSYLTPSNSSTTQPFPISTVRVYHSPPAAKSQSRYKSPEGDNAVNLHNRYIHQQQIKPHRELFTTQCGQTKNTGPVLDRDSNENITPHGSRGGQIQHIISRKNLPHTECKPKTLNTPIKQPDYWNNALKPDERASNLYSIQNYGSPSPHDSNAPSKKKKKKSASKQLKDEQNLQQGKQQSDTSLLMSVSRFNSGERLSAELPSETTGRKSIGCVSAKNMLEIDEIVTSSDIPSNKPQVSPVHRVVEMPPTESFQVNTIGDTVAPSISPSRPGKISALTKNTVITPKSQKDTSKDLLDIEQVLKRDGSAGKSLKPDLGTVDSMQCQTGTHNGDSARDEKHISSPTKKSIISGSDHRHEKISSGSPSRAKSKKILTPKIQTEGRPDAEEATPIPALDDEVQFPALGSTKTSIAITRERGGSFVAALHGSKEGEPESIPGGVLPRRDSGVTSLCISFSAKHESHVEEVKETNDEAWPEAHFGR